MPTTIQSRPGVNERFRRKLESALAHVTAADLMTPDPHTLKGDMSVAEFDRTVVSQVPWSSFPLIAEDGALAGLVVLRRPIDLTALSHEGLALRDIAIPVEQLTCVDVSSTALEVLSASNERSAGRVLVMRGGRLAGIIAPSDIEEGLAWRNLSWEVHL